ncbi:Ubiquinone/menaquinone biosynthesis C-methylase UbiE [Marivirga sericea]|uniref:Ubiquinone/menaquinone biosynthesis C-methylase UbiE n=1 Tax=Marivirga sericea TaxID=1028 RepID=A0A1X7KT64_9BACT|nr:methyltransferase domain-containing protein [Marivirga sericea]SMG44069.1 Ubiquinone/menaquinone biosynthesis C-methylase UbiE [Marivirga sericea]
MRKVDLSYRSEEAEIMDDLSDNSPSLYRALKELDIINHLLGGNAVTLKAIKKVFKTQPQKNWLIADLGCGSGEMLLKIAKWSRKQNIKVELHGFDANPNVVAYAKKHCKDFPEISFYAENIFSESFKNRKFDVMTCTLFLHHFSKVDLVQLLGQFRKQSDKVIINDLHRHPFAYYSIKWITKFLSKSSMVKNDACLSVWRAFTRKDWEDILEHAEISKYRLVWRWAFRWRLVF